MKNHILRQGVAFCCSVILCIVFLLLGACLPQQPIDDNVLASAKKMLEDGSSPVIADKSYASMLDVTTDALILAESKATTIAHWETIFTNPLYEKPDMSPVDQLYSYARGEYTEVSRYYVQYWMGFRPVMRLMLTVLDYHQILRYVAFSFFVLLAAALCSVANHTNTKTAFLFALSIILVRPHIIAVSLQFSCCFLIAFLAMLLVPWLHSHNKWIPLFFLELGIATMYFDFYTTPIITFGLPMIYLYTLKAAENTPLSVKEIGANALSWFLGYVGMWVAKLALTSALTGADGISTGMLSFMGRIGITKTPGLEAYYDPIMALRTVAMSLYSDQEGKWILLIACVLCFAALVFLFLRQKHSFRDLLSHHGLLIIAALPIIWFMVAAQPTGNHHWFQYRGIAVAFWAGFLYLQYLLQPVSRRDNII